MRRGDLKFFYILFLIFLAMPLISAPQIDLGTFESGSCIELIQLCGDCTYNNITSIQYPNETKVILDVRMTQRGTEFNYTYCFPDLNGRYNINGFGDLSGDDTVWAYTLLLTPNGDEPTTAKLLLQFGLIFILTIFLVFAIVGIFNLENYIARFTLYWVAHILLIAISFMAWNGSLNLLTSASFIIGFFKILFYFSIISAFPMIILSLAWIFYTHLMNDEIKRLMGKGFDEDEAFSRAKSKFGRKKR